MSLTLSARARTQTGRHAAALRREGLVPAVVYGHQQPSTTITADARELERLFHRAGRSTLVDLVVDGGRPRKVLIREFQVHPRTGRPLHADFFAVNLLEKTVVEVPIVATGDSPAVSIHKTGQLQQAMSSIRVESLPGDIPGQITVDISGLTEVDQSVTVGDLALPQGVSLVHADLQEVVLKIAPVRVREEVEEAAPAAEAEAAPAGETTPIAGE